MANIVHFYYIHPGESQCRIYYGGPHDLDVNPNLSPRESYRSHPESWREVGLMNHAGRIVCLDTHHPSVLRDIKDSEPLMGGTYFRYNSQGEPA